MKVENKPGTPEELVHFGVKGMKWGVRKTEGTKDFYAKNPTSSLRTAEIGRARQSVRKTKKAATSAKNLDEKRQLTQIHLSNPDRATALRMTRGEKYVTGLVLGFSSPSGLLPLAVAGTTAYRVTKRRKLEK